MTNAGTVGTVHELWRFPVKSMAGETLENVELTEQGILGDRAHALVDLETGKVVSAKRTDLFPRLLDYRAAFVEAPRPGRALPPVHITLPGGRVVTSDSPDVDRALSESFKRAVRLTHVDFSADPDGGRDPDMAPRLHPDFLAMVGVPAPESVSPFIDLYPVSVITTSTLARLSELAPGSRFDVRRFRMNVIVRIEETGFPENDWVGREVALGDGARIEVALPDPRCALTTLAQGDLPKDAEVLKAMVRHNTLEVGGGGPYPCAGVYAVVVASGRLHTGDHVTVH